MKYQKLKEIVENKAQQLKLNAAYCGAWDDGGCSHLLGELTSFKNKLIVMEDLRPSEFNKLYDIEVGEPDEFYDVIHDYKMKIATEIKL